MSDEEQKNSLLAELRAGLGQVSGNQTPQAQKAPSQSGTDSKEEMLKVLAELRQKMAEIDKITEDLSKKREELEEHTPKRTEKLLQEIKVPPLEMLK
jgi:predicted  nucleic acid-binding Zn-ribbon protein